MRTYEGNVITKENAATCRAAMYVVPKAPWKSKQFAHGTKSSRTPGKTKGPTCQTDSVKKFFFTHPHAYMHPQYGVWCQIARNMNGGKKAQSGA
jgi:hypothetical protein